MRVACVFVAVIFLSPGAALAYVDPGSGSVALQLLLAGLAGVGVIVRLLWGRILAVLGVARRKDADAGGGCQGP